MVRSIGERAYDVGYFRVWLKYGAEVGVGRGDQTVGRVNVSTGRSVASGLIATSAQGWADRSADYSSIVFCSVPATACSASSSIGGSALPRRSARRRIPSHAFRLK